MKKSNEPIDDPIMQAMTDQAVYDAWLDSLIYGVGVLTIDSEANIRHVTIEEISKQIECIKNKTHSKKSDA